MCATLRSHPWETSQGSLSLEFPTNKSYSHTVNGIIAIKSDGTQLPKLTKSELFEYNQHNCHLRRNKKRLT